MNCFCSKCVCVFIVIDVVVRGFDVDGIIYVFYFNIFDDWVFYIYCVGCIGWVGK